MTGLWVGDFHLLHSAQAGSGADRASYSLSTGSSFPRGRAACASLFYRSFQSNAEVKNKSTLPYAFGGKVLD